MTPRGCGFAAGSPRYLPTLFGVSQVDLVRSGLICFQLVPPSTVFQRWLFAKNSVRLSTCENSTGIVRTVRNVPCGARPDIGPTVDVCPVRRSNRVTLRPP